MEKQQKFYKSNLLTSLASFFSSDVMLLFYILIFFSFTFYKSTSDFFIADDFSWIRWAKDSTPSTLALNFIDAQGFFFRPIDKAIIYVEYALFGLNPFFYKIVNLLFNFSATIAVYFLFKIIFKKKNIAFLGALLFTFLPSHTQNIFWFATISTTISTGFILFGLITFYNARVKNSSIYYLLTYVLMALAVFSYENAIVFVFLMGLIDIFLIPKKKRMGVSKYLPYIVSLLIIALYLFLRMQSGAAGFSGDYNYNLLKAVPNSAGNYLGYVIMLFSGENLLYVYENLRVTLRNYWIFISIAGVFVSAFLGGFIIEHKEKIRLPHGLKLFTFGLLFSILSLLPYLPLGNITMRYIYLASFGFIVMIICILQYAKIFFDKKNISLAYSSLIVCIAIGGYVYMQNASLDWMRASQVTRQTFQELQNIHSAEIEHLYVYNIPIKSAEAYIFPVGFHDMAYLAGLEGVLVFTLSEREKIDHLIAKDRAENVSYKYYYFDNSFRFLKHNEE